MLTLKSAETLAPSIVRIDAKLHGETVRDYAAAVARQKAAEAEGRAAKAAADALKNKLLALIGDAPAAICGNAVLTVKQTAGADAALTTREGAKIPWSAVSGLTVGNQYVAASDVSKIFGGRDGHPSLTVAGEV